MGKSKSRKELSRLIVNLMDLPPGKDSENYFSKGQLSALVVKITEMKQQNENMSKQLATMTERAFDDTGSPKS